VDSGNNDVYTTSFMRVVVSDPDANMSSAFAVVGALMAVAMIGSTIYNRKIIASIEGGHVRLSSA
jgi:hypothetical protein